MPHMTQRTRKLVGAFLLVGSIIGWGILGTWLYLLLPEGMHPLVLVAFFIVAGMGWVIPAMPLIRWMARPDHGPTNG